MGDHCSQYHRLTIEEKILVDKEVKECCEEQDLIEVFSLSELEQIAIKRLKGEKWAIN